MMKLCLTYPTKNTTNDLEVNAGAKAAEEVNRLLNVQEQGVKTLEEYRKRLEESTKVLMVV